MIGRRLNHYTVVSKLGEGGMAEVYLAHDERLDRDVALKVLPDEMARDATRIARFEREAKVVAALNHPNIVTIHSVEEADGVRFLIMEFVDGRSLDELIPEGGLDLGSFHRLAAPLLDAVAAAHRRGITHRDIKPANVMVNSEGVVKLLDLGLAKLDPGPTSGDGDAADTLTRRGRAIGTVPYMAPEQLSGEPIDHRVDIFALGVLLFEMLTCRRPFVGSTSAEVISAILEQTPKRVAEIRTDLPEDLARVVGRCLEKDPGDRYQSARELREDLERALGRGRRGFEQTTGRETVRMRRFALPSGRGRQWLLASVIALAVTVVVAGLFTWWRSQGGSAPAPAAPSASVLSLAVSPLSYETSGEAPRFAHQLEREILGRLGAIEGLDLIASSRGAGSSPPEADYLLWGAVEELTAAGGEPRIRASFGLLRNADGRDIWTESFDRSLDSPNIARREIALLVESRVGRLLGFPVPEVADLSSSGHSVAPAPPSSSGAPSPARTTIDRSGREPGARADVPGSESSTTGSPPTAAASEEAVGPPSSLPLAIDLDSEVASGTVTVYADERQILRETFHFTEPREGVLGRLGVRQKAGGELHRNVETPPEVEELRIYVAPGHEPARQLVLAVGRIASGARLVIEVAADGTPRARLE